MRPFVLILLALAACAPEPGYVAQSRANIVLQREANHSLQQSFAVAERHCRQYGREAQYRGSEPINRWEAIDTFDCRAT
jgi:hypothetical protein